MNLASWLSGPLPARAAAIAGAAGAVAITVFYLVRLRRRRVVVSFAPLWLDAAGPRRMTSWARRLRDPASLLLALAMLGLVLLAAVDRGPPADRAGAQPALRLIDLLRVDGGARRQRDAAGGGAGARDRDRRRVGREGSRAVASFAADAVAESGFEAEGRLAAPRDRACRAQRGAGRPARAR